MSAESWSLCRVEQGGRQMGSSRLLRTCVDVGHARLGGRAGETRRDDSK